MGRKESNQTNKHTNSLTKCADPEGGQGVRTPSEKSPKCIGFLSNTCSDPLKNFKAAKPAFIGTPAKRH